MRSSGHESKEREREGRGAEGKQREWEREKGRQPDATDKPLAYSGHGQQVHESASEKERSRLQAPVPASPLPSHPPSPGARPVSPDLSVSPNVSLEALWRSRRARVATVETADSAWLKRSAELVPLAGSIPFNGEPPLSTLMRHMRTPNELHYVRNHGPVPRIDVDAFELKVEMTSEAEEAAAAESAAAAERKEASSHTCRSWSLASLQSLPSHSVLATAACDGVRRKELNMLEHTTGFDSAAGFTSTALWTGVLLADLLDACGLTDVCQRRPHWFLCFDSCDELSHGSYGTSLPVSRAMARDNEILLAWAMNGEPLPPDHGRPLRLVVPGMVGGRWVKWLQRITLSVRESDNHYHVTDNRALPPNVSIAAMRSGRYDGRPEFRLYELNVNSVISTPGHDEWHELSGEAGQILQCSGYAYAGGGRRVVLVEVSADGGKSWTPADVRYPDAEHERREVEKRNEAAQGKGERDAQKKDGEQADATSQKAQDARAEAGSSSSRPAAPPSVKVWSWCWWSARVNVWSLLSSSQLLVRATDEARNTQPVDLRWNATGMLNNALYRVKIDTLRSTNPSNGQEQLTLRFVHPVLPGPTTGGWMAREYALLPRAGIPASSHRSSRPNPLRRVGPSIGIAAHKAHKLMSEKEVMRHRSVDDCWIVMNEAVYDVTSYMKDHPGGACALLAAAHLPLGQVDELFQSIHGSDAYGILGRFLIGNLVSQELIDALDAYQAAREAGTGDECGAGAGAGAGAGSAASVGATTEAGAESIRSCAEPSKPKEQAGASSAPLGAPSPRVGARRWSDLQPDAASEAEAAAQEADRAQGKATPSPPPPGSIDRLSLVRASSSKEVHPTQHRRPNYLECPPADRRHPRTGQQVVPPLGRSGRVSYLLHSTRWQAIELVRKTQITHDTYTFVFRPTVNVPPMERLQQTPFTQGEEKPAAADSTHDDAPMRVGLSTGQHLLLGAWIDGEWVARAYTPIRPCGMSSREDDGSFELLVKIYRADPHSPFPSGGRMSQWLERMAVGRAQRAEQILRVRGPTGFVLYDGDGCFNIHGMSVQAKFINLIAGGTGITPLYQLLHAILAHHDAESHEAVDPSDSGSGSGTAGGSGSGGDGAVVVPQMALVFANKTPADILLRQELEELQRRHAHRLHLCFIVSNGGGGGASGKEEQLQHAQEESATVHAPLHSTAQSSSLRGIAAAAAPAASSAADPPRPLAPSDPSSPPSASTAHVPVLVGHVNAHVLRRRLLPPSADTLTFLCGPPGLIDALYPPLGSLGFTDNHIVEY